MLNGGGGGGGGCQTDGLASKLAKEMVRLFFFLSFFNGPWTLNQSNWGSPTKCSVGRTIEISGHCALVPSTTQGGR